MPTPQLEAASKNLRSEDRFRSELGMSRRELSMFGELLLIRVALGLDPESSTIEAVRVLHDDGHEAFNALRGDASPRASQWFPS